LSHVNLQISTLKIIYIQFVSSLGKYLPGKVATLIGKVYITPFKNSKLPIIISTLYEQLFVLLSAIILSIPFLMYFGSSIIQLSFSPYFLIIPSLLGALLVTHPFFLKFISRLISKIDY
jgi:hypothetical protein